MNETKDKNSPTGGIDRYKISLTGAGISIEKEIGAELAASIVAQVVSGKAPTALKDITNNIGTQHQDTSGTEHGSVNRIDARTTVREFLNDISPSTNVEMITAIGYFLWKKDGKETFSTEDIKSGYKSARESLPGNISRDMGKVVKAGWAGKGSHSQEYFITNTGAKAVESSFEEL